MAGESRNASLPLKLTRDLEEKPYEFDFFQAVRRLECLYREKPRVGVSYHATDDAFRLAQKPTLAFAPSTVASFEPQTEEHPPRLSVYSFGLLGPNGPLPLHLTEYVRDRQRNSDDPTFARFLDVFHHRMLALFYRAWASAQPTVNFDRPDDDRFSVFIGSLFGLALPALRDRDAMPDMAKLHLAGQLSCQTRHADGLRAMLGEFFKVEVEVEEFVGQWLELPHGARWRLGETPETGTLGLTTTVGASIWERQRKFRIVMGPMGMEDYKRMLPDQKSLDRLTAMVRNYVGDEMMWDVKLILDKKEVPPLVLGGRGRLGRTTWLAGRPFVNDVDDLLLDPLARELSHG